MSEATMIPFMSGDGLQAGVGGAIGSLLGSWWSNGFGGAWGGRYPSNAGTTDAVLTSSVLNELSGVSDQIGNVNTTLLQSQAAQNTALCQGFSGTVDAINRNSATMESNLCAGFSNLASTVQNASAQTRFENMSNFSQLASQLGDCCCKTQNAITSGFGSLALENCHNTGAIIGTIKDEESATRGLINQNYIHELETRLCDAKSKISSLESQAFTSAAIAGQSAIFDTKLNNAVNTIITHVKALMPETTTTTA